MDFGRNSRVRNWDLKLRRHTGTVVVGAPQQVTLQPSTEPQIDAAPATTAVTDISTDIAI